MRKLFSILTVCLVFTSCSPDRVLKEESINKETIKRDSSLEYIRYKIRERVEKSKNLNPKNAFVNANGCVECDNYAVGDTFVLNERIMIVADKWMLKDAVYNGDDLTQFCTSKITDMRFLFSEAKSFNQDIGNWDVSNVTNMGLMFVLAESFNQDIGNWDVSNVTDMVYMFSKATSFNQDLTQWCVSNFSSMPHSFSYNSALTESNHPVWGTCP